jgi:hypothetical protein
MTDPENQNENINITQARESLKHHIELYKSLLDNIDKGKEPLLSRSVWASWCLYRYIQDRLLDDIEKAGREHGRKN